MEMKHISLTLPASLLKASEEHAQSWGYRTVQEFVVELIRKKVIMENAERYREIEERMKKGKGVKKFSSKEKAIRYLKNL